jgi:hypothetical protein
MWDLIRTRVTTRFQKSVYRMQLAPDFPALFHLFYIDYGDVSINHESFALIIRSNHRNNHGQSGKILNAVPSPP